MKKKFGLKATLTHRIIAKGIDLFIVFTVGMILPSFIGPLLALAYSLAADGIRYGTFPGGQSIGKKFMGLQVISHLRKGQTANYRDSVVRNIPMGVITFFLLIPVWGWLMFILVGLPLIAIEIYLIINNENAQRLGDIMADTEVIEALIASSPAPEPTP